MNTPVNRSIFNDTGCIRKEELLRYRDNRMSNAEKHDVEEHLVDCELCSDALEGLMLISSTAVLDEVNHKIGKLTQPGTTAVIRPWLAAATIAGVLIVSYITYKQYSELKEERIAQKETVTPENNPPVIAPAVTTPAGENISLQSAASSKKLVAPSPVISKSEKLTATETDANAPAASDEAAAIGAAEPAVPEKAIVQETAELNAATSQTGNSVTLQSDVAKDISFSSAPLNNASGQNITYIDNTKIIDYNDYQTMPATVADVPRGTPSKFQNEKKKSLAAETEQKEGTSMKRKADYLDMVADPVILFNNGRFESANEGFDKLLKQNSNDQNAAFYKGLSLYNMQKCDPALKLLEPLSNDSTSPFMEEAKYYTAKTYICKGNISKGKMMLEGISNTNGFYSKQAQDDLKNIRP